MLFLSTSCSPSLTVPDGFVRSDSDRINGLLFSAVCKTVKENSNVRTEEYREGWSKEQKKEMTSAGG